MSKVLVLASGGLDSSVVVALYKSLGYDVHLIYFPYGNANLMPELFKIESLMHKFNIPADNFFEVDLNFNYSNSSTIKTDSEDYYVEGRNLVFISHALSYAEAKGIETIALGFIQPVNTHYPDAEEAFLTAINNLAITTTGICVTAPLINLDKKGVYELGVKLGVKLKDTVSCSHGTEPNVLCGKCMDCLDIRKLIEDAKIPASDNPFFI